ncbi:Rieske 2Fe-2S domain-containing protein [Rubrobacter marinus]|uniref:Rieske 2Fe-2S domain-containing protein n=1 Tax=Rubrobacter marinus TaxID=2653852 RepID=A0A6G8PYC0_9ACTN|nr:Rieske 2Fe-2S domain-containing protein [Rubrobacter marinus]QIN79196.1 Rieske 2Fe-2S domain-containing protein [Rubrobacter marinus]
MTDSERWTRVCAEDDVPFLEGRRVEVGGFYVGVFNTEEGFYAVYDVCPHRGGPLSDGDVAAATVTCPLHARKIDLKTGEVLNDEGLSCTFAFSVKREEGFVYLDTRALASLGAPSPA